MYATSVGQTASQKRVVLSALSLSSQNAGMIWGRPQLDPPDSRFARHPPRISSSCLPRQRSFDITFPSEWTASSQPGNASHLPFLVTESHGRQGYGLFETVRLRCQDLVPSSHQFNCLLGTSGTEWPVNPWDCRLMTAAVENWSPPCLPPIVSVGYSWEATLTIISSRLEIHQCSRHHVGIEEGP
jgi:hypothetical protein